MTNAIFTLLDFNTYVPLLMTLIVQTFSFPFNGAGLVNCKHIFLS